MEKELKLNGTIKVIGDLKKFDSGFQKVEFVLTTDDKYPQDVKLECVKETADKFLQYNKVGDKVDVSFNVRGNEYEGKYYVNLIAWKVFKQTEEAPTQENENSDDLPF